MEFPLKDLVADYRRYRAEDRNPFWAEGFWILVIHRGGRLASGLRNPVLKRAALIPILFFRKLFGTWFGITIPFSVRIGGGMFLPHFGGIFIHDDSVIGEQCSLYQGVTLGAKGSKHGAPLLGHHVNVGAGAVILGPITVGDYVDIGANAVVLCGVPGHSLAVGVPAVVKPKPTPAARHVFA
jgi:serine O-acetyltransferase